MFYLKYNDYLLFIIPSGTKQAPSTYFYVHVAISHLKIAGWKCQDVHKLKKSPKKNKKLIIKIIRSTIW